MTGAVATADVVIVGAGSAGCVAAERLSRRTDRSVIVLDAGPTQPPSGAQTRLTHLPIGRGSARVHRYAEEQGRDVVRGRGLGGSSAVNGGYFLRGRLDDYAAWPWSTGRISGAFAEVEAAMSVSAFTDPELGSAAVRFEDYWTGFGGAERVADTGWCAPGLIRVRSNRRDGRRVTAADAFLAHPRPGLRIVGDAEVSSLAVRGPRVTGVHTARGRIDAGLVILAAGTIGTAMLLSPVLGDLDVVEHAERLVRFTPTTPMRAPALLQSVLHTADGLEIRCYGDDFAAFIDGVPHSGVAVGVADLHMPTRGRLGSTVDLGAPDPASLERMNRGVDAVCAMLASPTFADIVVPGSIRVDDVVGLSSHAWGTLPLGAVAGADGGLPGLEGMAVVDGSVLPPRLHAGPHAGVMAAALLIAGTLDP